MKRRDFVTLLGGAAAAWPLAARAQPRERMRHIGVLIHLSEGHPAGQRYVAGFQQALRELGWTDGGNVRIDVRWIAGDLERLRLYAGKLVALAPDVAIDFSGLLRARCERPRLREAQKNASIHPSSRVIRGLIFARREYLGTLAAPR